jgi:hypothetical protein
MANERKATGSATSKQRDASKAEQIAARRRKRGTGEVADWGACDSGKLRAAVEAVTSHGFALMLGYTRDAGAYTIRIVGLDDVEPDYVRPTEDIDVFLEALALDFD